MECSSEVRKSEVKQICRLIDEKFDSSIHLGVLLCEGEENSIDVKLYSKVYPYLLVISSGGCADIVKLLPSIQKRVDGIPVFGLIDRDSNSKKEIRKLERESNVYCTKLPFIENIICTPEVIKIICRYHNYDYKKTIKIINEEILKALTHKLKDVLPVNLSISYDDLIENVTIFIKGKSGIKVEKTVDESNILYSYRDKNIANIVAKALGCNGRHVYYDFFIEMVDEPLISHEMLTAVRAYLPMIKVEC